MFLNNKKGDITLQQVVLIVIAVLMIFMVLGFGSKIWKSFFPDADKSTAESFNALYNILNAKSISQLSYDMTPATVYLGDDYCIVYFYHGGDIPYEGKTNTFLNKPSYCKGTEPCLCLYDDYPSDIQNERDKHVVTCKPITNPMQPDPDKYDFKSPICGNTIPYSNYLIIRKEVSENSVNIVKLYILKDSTDNRKLHDTWNVPKCIDTSNTKNICFGKDDGLILYPDSNEKYIENYNACKNYDSKTYASIEIKCDYDEQKRLCKLDCEYGNVLDECDTTYSTCEGYNQVSGLYKHITINPLSADYKYYYMCIKDSDYCGSKHPTGCAANAFMLYSWKSPDSISGAIPEDRLSNVLNSAIRDECKVKTIKIPANSNNYYLQYYDTTIEKCKTHFDTFFYEQSTVAACKKNNSKTLSCKEYIDTRTNPATNNNDQCQIKYIKSGDTYWITHYEQNCRPGIIDYFDEVYNCQTIVTQPSATPSN